MGPTLLLLLHGSTSSAPSLSPAAQQWSITLLTALKALPVLELASILINLVLFVGFLFVLSARHVFACLGRIRIFKDNSGSNSSSIRHNSAADGGTHEIRVGRDFKFSVFCCFYVLFVQVLVLGFEGVGLIRERRNGNVVDWSVMVLPAAQASAWFALSFSALHCKFKVCEKFPLLLRVWWSVSFLICLCTLYVDGRAFAIEGSKRMSSHVVANLAVTPALAFLCFVAFRGVTGIQVSGQSDLQEPLLEEEAGCLKVSPYHDAGLFSLATLSWMNPLLSIGAKRPLEIKDIPLLAPQDRAKTNYKILNSNWEKGKAENPSGQPSLAWAILKSFWKEAACNAVFAGLNTLVSYVGPFMISYFVDYLGGIETFPHEGYILAGTFFAAKLVETLTTRQWYLGVDILGMHVRSALTAMVYRKGLRLSSLAKQSHTSGEIVNYMAVDVQRIGDYSWYLHDMWMLPMQIILALAILYKNVGIASVATLIATIISIVLTVPVAKIQEEYQDKLMTAKDERMRKTSECLRNMRILKLQAWEDRYRLKLEEMRGVEFKWLRKALYSQAFITFMFWSSPIFVSAVTFGTSIFLGHHLTTGGVLSALATFRILQEPLRNFPDLVSMMAQTKVSLDRISGFLQEEELQEDATIVLPVGITTTSIEIEDGVFCWDPSSPRPTLSGIQMKVEKGMRVAVCGMVGAGKSSFLSCILGEIPKISGEVRLCGTAAYVPQSAWIQSGNIEENILFGSPMDKPKYKKVIHACSLKKDLELFSHGDQTIIGDRGINLSGGQKQRVQLARALYQDADIYLLDDPFSAVDAHTGSELFKEYILTALEDKTVVFVTHQVEFLPAADLILVLKGGRIIQAGKYDDLLQAGTDFKSLVSAHHEAIEAMDIPSNSSGDSDQSLCLDTGLRKNCDKPSSSVDCLAKEVQEGVSASEQKAIKEKKKAKRSRKKQLVQEEERVRGRVSMKVYFSYMAAAYKGLLIPPIIIAQTVFQFLQIASSWWMAWANPQTEGDQPKVSSMVLLVVYMALAFGSSWFIFVRAVLVATFGLAAAQKLFVKMLRSVFRAPMSFFDSTPAGRILNRVSIDQSVVDLDIPFRLGGFASTTIQLIGIVGVMTTVTWQVLLLVIPMAIACLWMQKYYMASSRELVRIVSIQKSPIIHLFGESIAGAATIRGFGQEKRFMKRNLYLLDCFARPFFCSIAAIEWLCLRMELLSTFVFAFCMILLVSFPHGSIDPSMAGLAVTYGLNLNARLSRWILSFCKLENKIISIERIYQYSQIPSEAPSVIEDSQPPSTWPENGAIDIIDLKVRYKENLPVVLHGVTCSFPGGKNIGIVGRTGSGKSTLIQALFRLIEPSAGRILIDNVDISTIGLHDLRSRLSIIPQDPTLFEGTIRLNLDPLEEHLDHEIWQALDKSQLGDIIREKEQKLDAPVLENGDNWSVGQRQLVSLGRALLKQAKILVLDEATASVDTATDNLIQKIIRTEFKNCTVCTIAHRIPTVIDSDLVLVLSDGRVAEFDTPIRLLEDKSSMFLKLVTEYSSRSIDAAFLAGAGAFGKFKDKWERTKVRAIFINPNPHLRKAVSDSSPSQIGEFFHGHYGADRPKYGSTLATKGVGHLVRKGTGGRSSVSGIVAAVFGSTGFLGRYLVQQLAKMGSQVLVPFRGSEDSHRHLKLMGDLGQIVPMKYNPRDEDSIKAVMAKANVVINLIGRDYETRNFSFEEVNHSMAQQLATISKEHGGIMRFIQVSCLGASSSSPSRFLRTKAAAEEAVLSELPEATILRPAVMVGTEDRILNRWAFFAKKYGFLPLIGDGSTKFQPVYVVDVAGAIVAALKDDGTSMGKVYELGGPEVFTMHQLAELMFDTIREWPRYVKVPLPIAKAMGAPREPRCDNLVSEPNLGRGVSKRTSGP
ncbi:ABC transporter C family member 5-like [Pyrus ussuriensis x Pyrus communis]|uniref:ABC-type xenobiotic transporter n=1 Tax=Pyrus ussuriensis x Pyrus communis TaxID=2448454 RepID=A0A5N5FGD7_9ROSA|nr:ABC transporter C family member 5-like [Pyrus ussuriensis x Pyrus communis]